MGENDVRSAVARRDEGIRRVRRLTWRAGAAGVVGSALIAVAFGHHASQAASHHPAQRGGILVPAQPPRAAPGSGQVNSGAS
jgi:hypothetical protein